MYKHIFCKISYGRFTFVLYPKIAYFLSELLSYVVQELYEFLIHAVDLWSYVIHVPDDTLIHP